MMGTAKIHTYDGQTSGIRWRIRAIEHPHTRGGDSNKIILKGGMRTLGHYCAYIEVPKSLVRWFEDSVLVHGGVTWNGESGAIHPGEYPEGQKCTEGCEVLGWDYWHYYDDEKLQTYEMIEAEVLEAVKLLVEKMSNTQGAPVDDGGSCLEIGDAKASVLCNGKTVVGIPIKVLIGHSPEKGMYIAFSDANVDVCHSFVLSDEAVLNLYMELTRLTRNGKGVTE